MVSVAPPRRKRNMERNRRVALEEWETLRQLQQTLMYSRFIQQSHASLLCSVRDEIVGLEKSLLGVRALDHAVADLLTFQGHDTVADSSGNRQQQHNDVKRKPFVSGIGAGFNGGESNPAGNFPSSSSSSLYSMEGGTTSSMSSSSPFFLGYEMKNRFCDLMKRLRDMPRALGRLLALCVEQNVVQVDEFAPVSKAIVGDLYGIFALHRPIPYAGGVCVSGEKKLLAMLEAMLISLKRSRVKLRQISLPHRLLHEYASRVGRKFLHATILPLVTHLSTNSYYQEGGEGGGGGGGGGGGARTAIANNTVHFPEGHDLLETHTSSSSSSSTKTKGGGGGVSNDGDDNNISGNYMGTTQLEGIQKCVSRLLQRILHSLPVVPIGLRILINKIYRLEEEEEEEEEEGGGGEALPGDISSLRTFFWDWMVDAILNPDPHQLCRWRPLSHSARASIHLVATVIVKLAQARPEASRFASVTPQSVLNEYIASMRPRIEVFSRHLRDLPESALEVYSRGEREVHTGPFGLRSGSDGYEFVRGETKEGRSRGRGGGGGGKSGFLYASSPSLSVSSAPPSIEPLVFSLSSLRAFHSLLLRACDCEGWGTELDAFNEDDGGVMSAGSLAELIRGCKLPVQSTTPPPNSPRKEMRGSSRRREEDGLDGGEEAALVVLDPGVTVPTAPKPPKRLFAHLPHRSPPHQDLSQEERKQSLRQHHDHHRRQQRNPPTPPARSRTTTSMRRRGEGGKAQRKMTGEKEERRKKEGEEEEEDEEDEKLLLQALNRLASAISNTLVMAGDISRRIPCGTGGMMMTTTMAGAMGGGLSSPVSPYTTTSEHRYRDGAQSMASYKEAEKDGVGAGGGAKGLIHHTGFPYPSKRKYNSRTNTTTYISGLLAVLQAQNHLSSK
eukprot:jgi/Bigna1/74003/fgenesh1_pg.27_\